MKFERQLTTNRMKSLVLTSVTRLILRLTMNGMVKLRCMSERSTHTSFSRCFAYELYDKLYAKHDSMFSMYFYFILRCYTRLNTWCGLCVFYYASRMSRSHTHIARTVCFITSYDSYTHRCIRKTKFIGEGETMGETKQV